MERKREREPIFKKEDREGEPRFSLRGGRCLTLVLGGGGLSPHSHGQRPLWPSCAHACIPSRFFPMARHAMGAMWACPHPSSAHALESDSTLGCALCPSLLAW